MFLRFVTFPGVCKETSFHYGAFVNCRINFGVIRVKIRNSYSINFK